MHAWRCPEHRVDGLHAEAYLTACDTTLDTTCNPSLLHVVADSTALFGKWHLGFYQRAFTPLARGFDEHLGYFQGTVHYYTHQGFAYGGANGGLDWHRGNETSCFDDSGNYSAELIVPAAVDFLERKAKDPSKPFFL